MRQKLKFIWLISFIIGLFSIAVFAEGSNGNGANIISDPLKTIIVKKTAPYFTLTLQSNPTTGFTWSLKSYDNSIVVPISRKFYPPQVKKLIGAGGTEKWVFKVKPEGFVVPQTTSVVLIYARYSDQQGANAVNFKVVTVDGN